jgi:phenylpropionate dioxygenase-like ring-hydroxylating dioxygenase large terminal subunit
MDAMDHSKQVAILHELMSHIEAGTTARTAEVRWNRGEVYASRERLKLEKERLFDAYPLVAGLSGDVPYPGSFIAQDAAGTPFILTRGHDGKVRGFLNACRHRGTRLIDQERGHALRFSCPFHAWTYDLDGKLVGLPKKESFGEFDHASHGLISLPVTEKYGIIWLKTKPGPAFEIDDYLSGLGRELAGWNFGRQFSFDACAMQTKMNWKLANDTFGETYHFAILHRNTLAAIYHSNVTSYETFARNHRMVFAARSIHELQNVPEREWQLRPHSTIAYYIFPNTQLLVSRQNISMYRMFPDPDRPDRSVVYQSVYLDAEPANESERAVGEAALKRLKAVIIEEDFVVAEKSQAALSSGLIDEVAYGRNEPALHHYHRTFDEALAQHA